MLPLDQRCGRTQPKTGGEDQMLELLLRQYEETFGKPFPLLKVKGVREIDVINILYECLYSNTEYYDNMPVPENRFPDAPGMRKTED